MSQPEAPKYRTKNWATYNAALKSRSSLLVWFSRTWHGFAGQSGKRRRSETFSDAAIQFLSDDQRTLWTPSTPDDGDGCQPAQVGEAGLVSAGFQHAELTTKESGGGGYFLPAKRWRSKLLTRAEN